MAPAPFVAPVMLNEVPIIRRIPTALPDTYVRIHNNDTPHFCWLIVLIFAV
jgi:hypothetical protein